MHMASMRPFASVVAQVNVVRAICISKVNPLFGPPTIPQTIKQIEMELGVVDYVQATNVPSFISPS
jgi:hypothetical protein